MGDIHPDLYIRRDARRSPAAKYDHRSYDKNERSPQGAPWQSGHPPCVVRHIRGVPNQEVPGGPVHKEGRSADHIWERGKIQGVSNGVYGRDCACVSQDEAGSEYV